jgi:hypothetical protein
MLLGRSHVNLLACPPADLGRKELLNLGPGVDPAQDCSEQAGASSNAAVRRSAIVVAIRQTPLPDAGKLSGNRCPRERPPCSYIRLRKVLFRRSGR